MFIYTSHHSISSIISKPQKSHHKVYTVPNSTQTGIPIESYTSSNFPEKSQNRNFTHRTPYAYHMTHTRPYAYHLASYAYHTHFTRTQNGLETNPYAYQPHHTRITRIVFLFPKFHTRMSIPIRSHTQNTSTWFLGQGNCVSYAYSPLGVSPIRVSVSFHTRMVLFHTRNTRKRPVTCRIRHRPKPIRSYSYQSTNLSPKTRKIHLNIVRIHPQT